MKKNVLFIGISGGGIALITNESLKPFGYMSLIVFVILVSLLVFGPQLKDE